MIVGYFILFFAIIVAVFIMWIVEQIALALAQAFQ